MQSRNKTCPSSESSVTYGPQNHVTLWVQMSSWYMLKICLQCLLKLSVFLTQWFHPVHLPNSYENLYVNLKHRREGFYQSCEW